MRARRRCRAGPRAARPAARPPGSRSSRPGGISEGTSACARTRNVATATRSAEKSGGGLLRSDRGRDVLVVRQRLVGLAQVLEPDVRAASRGRIGTLLGEEPLGVALPRLQARGRVLGLVHLGEARDRRPPRRAARGEAARRTRGSCRRRRSRGARARRRNATRSSPLAVRAAASRLVWNRSESSAAALIVNVTAERRSIVVAPVRMSAVMRSTRLVVLPVPAAASTSSEVPRSSRIARRGVLVGQAAARGLSLRHGSPGTPGAPAASVFASFAFERRAAMHRRRRRRPRSRRSGSPPCRPRAGRPRRGAGRGAVTRTSRVSFGVERHRHALALALAAREEVARARHRRGDPGPGEEDLEGHRVQGVLDLPAAVDARASPCAARSPPVL